MAEANLEFDEYFELYVVPQLSTKYSYAAMTDHVAAGLYEAAGRGALESPEHDAGEPPESVVENVLASVTESTRKLMNELWSMWTELGIDYESKTKNITCLMFVVSSLHSGIISETKVAIEKMKKRAVEELAAQQAARDREDENIVEEPVYYLDT